MLDDLKVIHERDAQDVLGIAANQWKQLQHQFTLRGNTSFNDVHTVVYTGMGGSALAALFVHTWPKLDVPFEVVRDYDLPNYVGPNTLVIAASYSGNTEETLSALAEAEARGAQIAAIAGGGKLEEIAAAKKYLFAQLPKAEQPRYAVLYNFKALLEMLAVAGVLKREAFESELEQTAEFLKDITTDWLADVPTSHNPAKRLAQEIVGKSAVVYSGPKMAPAAYKWKISFNENAKHVAWQGTLSEFNHNEFIGWSKQPTDKPYAVIDLRSNLEHERIQKRFEVSARLLSGMRPEPQVVEAQGETLLEQLMWLMAFGDFVTLYLAILNGVNPAPVDLVEKFKKELNN
jgi:glucose/mannose-6-phosphate isomerase